MVRVQYFVYTLIEAPYMYIYMHSLYVCMYIYVFCVYMWIYVSVSLEYVQVYLWKTSKISM